MPAISGSERDYVLNWILIAFVVRLVLSLFFHATDAELRFRFAGDVITYDRVGRELSEYWATGGVTTWPHRVEATPIDCLFDYEMGVLYLLFGPTMLPLRLINCVCGALVPLVVWRAARLALDRTVSVRAMLLAAWFPTQVFYSAIAVRDAQATLAMALIFLGLTAVAVGHTRLLYTLPLGLLLMLGFRGYIFTLIVVAIPIAWAIATVFAKSRDKGRFVMRATSLTLLCVLVAAGIGINTIFAGGEEARIVDVDYLNNVRRDINRGGAAMYDDGDMPELFGSVEETVEIFATGLYTFFFSVDPTEVNSFRQYMAIPEALLVLFAVPSLWRGFRRVVAHHLLSFGPPLLVAAAITLAYSSVATNGGAMMRWRLQTVNAYIIVAAIGWDRKRRTPEDTGRTELDTPRLRPAPIRTAARVADGELSVADLFADPTELAPTKRRRSRRQAAEVAAEAAEPEPRRSRLLPVDDR